jgi:hypothetical protein
MLADIANVNSGVQMHPHTTVQRCDKVADEEEHNTILLIACWRTEK